MPSLKTSGIDDLMKAVMCLENMDECYMFFEDICTISELVAISQRLKVARLLRDKKTCHEISESTGISTATISRVNKCLHYGTGGYGMVLNRLYGDKGDGFNDA